MSTKDLTITKRVKWMISVIAESFKIKESIIEESFKPANPHQPKNPDLLKDWLDGKSSKALLCYYQIQDLMNGDEVKEANADPSIFLTNGENERLKEKAVYFIRQTDDKKPQIATDQENDNTIVYGELSSNCLIQLQKVMDLYYEPMINQMEQTDQIQDFDKCEQESVVEFKQLSSKFSNEVGEALKSMITESGKLFLLDQQRLQSFQGTSQDQEKLQYFEKVFFEWLTLINDKLNDDNESKKDNPDDGPKKELDYWRSRMQKITSWCEQLKSKDFQMVRSHLFKHRPNDVGGRRGEENISKLMLDYNRLDLLLTDKLNEAKDNVKYLTTLEKFIDPLYNESNNSIQQIIDTLPALLNAIKMIHTIARFYNTSDKMTGLFMKITNQMIKNCINRITKNGSPEKIWDKDRDPAELIDVLGQCIKLNKEYKECYKETKDKVADMPRGKQFDFSETQIFGKFDLFCRRVLKLIDIFNTIQQFNSLARQNLEGMESLTKKFDEIINEFKLKQNKHLLEYQRNKFDRDYVEFNVEISHLDVELQNFIDNNFNRFRNIEYSLKLLHKFENTLKRDSLKHNLTSKYNAILHNYATELDNIQRVFTDKKNNPDIVRNMPPEAGKIIWARHLFQKITGPINLFPENVINSNEIKKYYGSYNTLGKQLTIYEMWYYQNWCNEIEKSKAALQATLIVRHDGDKKLYVNFDLEIMQLIREAKCMDRCGIEIPESARIILLQEEKFKMYYNELLYVLKEYERIISKIKPICKTLLAPHVEDLELKLRPGMVTLTWTSMNIDSYLHHVHQGLNKLEQLIINVNDIIENRIENNLKNVSKVILVELPHDSKPFSLEQFVDKQEKYIEKKKDYLVSKNEEVERAVDDLLSTIQNYPLDQHVEQIQPDETKRIKRYYFWYLYQALLNSTQNSLNAMKYRVCGRKAGGGVNTQQNLKPFFEVYLQLDSQVVKLNPSLEDIQKSINRAATAVLRCSKNLFNWEQHNKDNENKASFYEMIAQDKEIVKVILLLTGSIQGTKNKVSDFLLTFKKFDWLWMNNILDSLKQFEKNLPSLQDYEDKLKSFTKIEDEIDKIGSSNIIGAMELKTENLNQDLKNCAKEWKKMYAQDLHKRARTQLDLLTDQIKSVETKLKKDVVHIDSLGYVMEALENIREQQAEIDMKFNPVQDMYGLLDNYLPNGITDKDEMDSRSMLRRNWEDVIKAADIKQKELQQKQSIYLKELKKNVKDFSVDVKIFRKDYEQNGPMVQGISPKEAIERLRQFEDKYSIKHNSFKIYRSGEDLFGLQNLQYPELEQTDNEIKHLKKLYQLYAEVIDSITKWQEKLWVDTQVDQLKLMEEQIYRYSDQCLRLPKDLKEWSAYQELKGKIDNLKEILPIVTDLKKPSIKQRHWDKINELIVQTANQKPLEYLNEDNFFLSDLIDCPLLSYQEDIIDVTESADKQLKIEQALEEIRVYWETAEFEFNTWGKSRDIPCVLNGLVVQTITERLEEDQMTLTTLNAQRHVTPFKARVEELNKIFSEVAETLDLWIKVQLLWTSLEPVFTGGDIARQMPLEAKRFQGIDKNWLKIMEKAAEAKKVIPACQNDMLKDFLPDLQKGLESCQRSLEQYLEGKRKNFARFYFVDDNTLLKILSSGSEPTSIQDEFEKLFDAINFVKFENNQDKKASREKVITYIAQQSGGFQEQVIFLKEDFVKCEGNIEAWLKKLEKQMQTQLRTILREASAAVPGVTLGTLRDFVKQYQSQIALIGIQMIWTNKITEALERTGKNEKNAMDIKRKEIQAINDDLIKMCLEDIKSKLDRTKVETLVTIQVHQRDLAYEIKCKDVNDFDWQKQTRLYWKSDQDTLIISITDWDCGYSYEFIGSKERLCITPLTDRCYITLAQAMSMYYGGAPAGPAGTGKTETVKDMGRTLGVWVVVTNCSDQHKYRDMAKIFKGLCQSGLWGCFDEFNRIELEVLSVVAMQVEAITTAKKQHLKEFLFPEETVLIEIIESVGYFITMNPGYAGRQELPENLKVLFRGVTMMVPDREIIMKVKLASVGYNGIDALAKKFDILYKLCEEQLSKQRHYDFGLRNILSVLRTAGNTKRSEQDQDEEMLLMRALRDMNLSKFVADDIPLFNSLLQDIFPKQKNVPKKNYPDVEKKIFEDVKKKMLVAHPGWILKIIQLYETFNVRHGFMLVGPTGSGKTTIMNVLTDSLTELDKSHPFKMNRMNPKAILAEEMYGVKSEISDDWTPGVFSQIWSKANDKKSKFYTWIICDGPVDAIWIENLNTVLDDNKILTLANGERILMSENCKMVFEVENLNNASPATVSRCGIVYVSDTDLGYEPMIMGWLAKRRSGRQDECEKLEKILKKYFLEGSDFIVKLQKILSDQMMELSTLIQVQQTLNIITGLLVTYINQNKTLSDDEYDRIVLFAIVWSVGGVYEPNDRFLIHDYLKTNGMPIPQKTKEGETIFDYCLNGTEWQLIKPDEWKPPDRFEFSQLLLPTMDSYRCKMLMEIIMNQPKNELCNKAVLLIGGSGTAKTSSVIMYSQNLDKTTQSFLRMNFSSASQPGSFQNSIEEKCDAKIGKDFAPPGGKIMTVFIDDISMPLINAWGDQPTNEIVRQLIEQGGFYVLERSQRGTFKNIKNLQYVGAMIHPGGGRNDIPNRLKRQFFTFNMILPLNIDVIYGPIIKHVFKKFGDNIKLIGDQLPFATIKLWNRVKSTLLPTPAKFHYVFNMRDLSRIFKGVLNIKKESIMNLAQIGGNMKPEVYLIGLWRHECERVFIDKLINNKDKDYVLNILHEITLEVFPQFETDILEKFNKEKPIYFCNFLQEDIKNEEGLIEYEAPREYEAIIDMARLRARSMFLLEEYNVANPSKKMNLVLFDDALRHLLRISRAISSPRSSALLVGVGGSGKQSLVRLASFIARNVTYQIVITKNFTEKDLKEEIKLLFDFSGHQGKGTTFILTDAEVKKESFLEYINMMLSTGEIPGIIPKDEKEVWIGDITTEYIKERGNPQQDPTKEELFAYLIDRIRDKLHVVLCFSPVGPKFRERSQKFPALFNECTIDWFLPWPEEALISVAESFIKEFKELDTKPETKEALYKHMGTVHLMVSQVCDVYFQKMRKAVFVTPKSFLSYLGSYKQLYMTKYFDEYDVQEKTYRKGTGRINDAKITIGKMDVDLKIESEKLRIATESTNVILDNVTKQSQEAKIKNDECDITKAACIKQAEDINKEKEAANLDLQAALPALQAAEDAVNSLKNSDIVEMKANKKPHILIKFIMDLVCVFFMAKLKPITIVENVFKKNANPELFLDDSYELPGGGLFCLSNMQFLNQLKFYEKDNINEETIELLEPYLQKGEEWFNVATAANASVSAAGIMKWGLAVHLYHCKSKIVKPKRIQLAIAASRLEKAQAELAKSEEDLSKIQAKMAELQTILQKATKEKQDLEESANKTKKKITTANQLIKSLSDENDRWSKGDIEIGLQKQRLVGNCSLSCAFVSYCGPFNAEYRKMLQYDYFFKDLKNKNIPVTPNLELTSFLVDESVVGEWNLQGLPKDDLSIQNGIMVTNSSRYPLLIDPQGQGQNWIQSKYEEQIDVAHCVTTLNNPKFKDMFLKFSMEEGKCLIIEDIQNEVDPMLDPVLEKQVIKIGKSFFIEVGGTQIEYNKDFLMFMFCRLPNPAFSPELSAKTTIIDFTVTQGGLEQQLLGQVLSKEQKALEDSLNQLLADVNFNKKDLIRLDKNLLDRLTQASGNLLEDTELMDVLNQTKTQSREVAVKLVDAEIKTKEINEKREQYRPVAIRGSALYFCIIDMAKIDWMYNSSLEQFLKLFDGSIDESERVPLPSKRVEIIIKYLTFHVYKYVNRGLFERDKTSYILVIVFKILVTAGKITNDDVGIFLKAGADLDARSEKPKPFAFITEKAWLNVLALSRHHFAKESVAFFRELPDSMARNETLWKQWVEKNDPENYPVPDFTERINSEKEIGPLVLMCLVRAIREDRTQVSSFQFIEQILGKEFNNPIAYTSEQIWSESSNLEPMLYLLSSGADPTASIEDLAKRRKKYPCKIVSMGEGQDKVAREACHDQGATGGWVILHNCHLGIKFMQELLDILTPDANLHEDFRLYITCEPSSRFPLGLLQRTIKVTNEPPKGLKAGLYKTFNTLINQDFLDKIDHTSWRSLIFTVCFLHSIVIERRKFGPLGWNIPYAFNYSDLEASLMFVEKYLSNLMSGPTNNTQNLLINTTVLKYMICEVQYGGRITDNLDRELFNAYGDDYIKDGIFGHAEHQFYEVALEGTGNPRDNKFKYKIPSNPTAEISKYREYIDTIPQVDNPEVFGLHANADLTFRLKESQEMINTLMETRPKDASGGGGKSREELCQEKAKDILTKLPTDYNIVEVRQTINKLPGPRGLNEKGIQVPSNTFLYQEIQRMQLIISKVRKTCNDIILAVDGQIIMTPDIVDAISAISDAKAPNSWSYDPTGAEIAWILPQLGAWTASLVDRNNQLNSWLRVGRPNTYWLTGFFNPQGFLTSVKQEITRMHSGKGINVGGGRPQDKDKESWSLDDVVYLTNVKEREYDQIKDAQNSEGVYIHGLFLEGARWHKSGLEDAEPKKLYAPLPILHVAAQNKKKMPDQERNSTTYSCPVYKYPKRTDRYIIFRVNLPCEGSGAQKWKLRGVALLCSTD